MSLPNRSNINQAVQSQKQARSLKFRILEEEELYYPCCENKGADQTRGYREADLRLCFLHMQIVGFLMRRLICYIIIVHGNPCKFHRTKVRQHGINTA